MRLVCRLNVWHPEVNDLFMWSGAQADKIATLVKAANVSVESYWPGLFAKLLEKRSVDDLITNVGSGTRIGIPVWFCPAPHSGVVF